MKRLGFVAAALLAVALWGAVAALIISGPV